MTPACLLNLTLDGPLGPKQAWNALCQRGPVSVCNDAGSLLLGANVALLPKRSGIAIGSSLASDRILRTLAVFTHRYLQN